MANFNGDIIFLQGDGSIIACGRALTFTSSRDIINTTNKDSAMSVSHVLGNRTHTVTFDGVTDYSASFGAAEFLQYMLDNESIEVVLASTVSGDMKITGTVDVANIDIVMNHNTEGTYSGTLQFNGAITKTTV